MPWGYLRPRRASWPGCEARHRLGGVHRGPGRSFQSLVALTSPLQFLQPAEMLLRRAVPTRSSHQKSQQRGVLVAARQDILQIWFQGLAEWWLQDRYNATRWR